MRPLKITITAASGVALALSAAYQSRATVILDHGPAGCPVVETGGLAVRPDALPPAIGFFVIDEAWLAPPGIWLWSPVTPPPFLTRTMTRHPWLPARVGFLRPSR